MAPKKNKMAAALTSFLKRGLSGVTGTNPNGAEFETAESEKTLFQKTDPEVDGEECLHDCDSCTIKYPSKFKVEEDDDLYGHVKGWSTHLLVATGKTDWVRDVADEKGSVMQAVDKCKAPSNGKIMLSASNIPVPHDANDPYAEPTRVLLLPAFTWIDNVSADNAPLLVEHIIAPAPTNTTPLGGAQPSTTDTNGTTSSPPITTNGTPTDTSTTPSPSPESISIPPSLPFTSTPCPHSALILMCSQRTRDARCGQSAPLLRREFERHLRPRGLYRDASDARPGGVGVFFISHVGGHKYSANVMVYRRAEKREGEADGGASQCIWLARVRPEDCENIVRYTVLQGKVVKPERQLRGGFDREKGLVSW